MSFFSHEFQHFSSWKKIKSNWKCWNAREKSWYCIKLLKKDTNNVISQFKKRRLHDSMTGLFNAAISSTHWVQLHVSCCKYDVGFRDKWNCQNVPLIELLHSCETAVKTLSTFWVLTAKYVYHYSKEPIDSNNLLKVFDGKQVGNSIWRIINNSYKLHQPGHQY